MASPSIDPVPPSAWPSFTPVSIGSPPSPPDMPRSWSATVLLQPFSPPQYSPPNEYTPFFELCVADLKYRAGDYFYANVYGCVSGNTWEYFVGATGNNEMRFNGGTWTPVQMGWSLPSNWLGGEERNAVCCGASPLNWMKAQTCEWWRVPVPHTSPPAATWAWFDASTGAPVRMMFGQGPLASPDLGDPTQLALLQMFSFSYFPVFTPNDATLPESADDAKKLVASRPTFQGFAIGNPKGYKNFVWNGNFGMTAFMTPVNENFAPLPTRVLYVWKPDGEYEAYSDRAQNTLMDYRFNRTSPIEQQEALLTGPAPRLVSPGPENSDCSWIISYMRDGDLQCTGPSHFDFPQEPPTWVSIPPVEGTIQATITNNPVLGPNQVITVYSVLFPPSSPNYPESTYLWTWYVPQNPSGTESRPVTFMQSQSGVNVGTSLALADYFYYQAFRDPIEPANFDVPAQCSPCK
jgi:hypothetical protein